MEPEVTYFLWFMMPHLRPYSIQLKDNLWRMTGKDLEGSSHILIEVLPQQHLPARSLESHKKKKNLMIAHILDKIQTKHLPNTSL
jgi:hypothetical protein